jgi:dienelactone hydrolase
MVQEYYVARFRQAAAERRARWAKVRTAAAARALQEECRRKVRQSFGRLPRRTPLNARTTGRIETQHFTVEKVLFESRPGLVVSANLYVPNGLKAPAPCVLGACGHSNEGKAADYYQTFCRGLARKGFVVLIYDPISQSERVQYPDEKALPKLGLCAEHNMIGNQQSLVGEFFGTWRAWDGIRALDYLLGRGEVDPKRVGVTGNSGGGTMTTWLVGLDDRITMAAPSCFVTTFLSNVENELPADVEQIPPRLVELGLDEHDLLVGFAPRPLLLLSQANDFFDQRGTRQAFEDLRLIYQLLGAEDKVQMVTGPTSHGYTQHLREPMYGFFAGHANLQVSPREPKVQLVKPAELFAAEGGSVHKAGSKLVFDFSRVRADELAGKRPRWSAEKLAAHLERVLALPKRLAPPHHRVLRSRWDGKARKGYQFYAIETEPGIQAIVTMPLRQGEGAQFRVPPGKACTLLVPHLGAWADLNDTALGGVLGEGRLFAVDPRGIGESMSSACDQRDFFAPYDNDYFYNACGLLLGEPYVGRRTHDVLCSLDWLAASGYREIHLVGRGMGSIPALFAAAVGGSAAKVTLVGALLSYHELTQTPIYRWPASAMVPRALETFDLPDCCRALGKKLTLIDPWDAQMKGMPLARARRRLEDTGLAGAMLRGKQEP